MTRQTSAVNPITAARRAQRPPLSREGLAFKAHLSLRTIERIEAGEVIPHRVTRRAIAEALGSKTTDLWPELEEAA